MRFFLHYCLFNLGRTITILVSALFGLRLLLRYLQSAYHVDNSAGVVPCVHVFDWVVITVGKRLGQVESAVLVEGLVVIHEDVVFIINTIVMNMFLTLKAIGIAVLNGEPAHGQ